MEYRTLMGTPTDVPPSAERQYNIDAYNKARTVVGNELRFISKKYRPFCPPGVYKIVDIQDNQPIIIGTDGYKLRLDNKGHYTLL